MSVCNPLSQFSNDQRAVSAVIGFILLFGLLMLTLTVYQAQIVPQQNAQTEFQHFENVRNELIELRNAVSTAGQADVSQFPSVTLGTNYRTRTLTINPPDPAGTLRTSEPYNITIKNKTGSKTNISTRFIEYRPGYNEISIGSTWYEHSVLYLDERDRGGVSIIQEQNIVKNGTVRITALQNRFQETDTGRVTLELYPEEEVNKSAFPSGNGANLNVTVPTRLNQSDYWGNASLSDSDIYQSVDPYPGSDDVYKLNLSVNESDLEVNTVGIRGVPDEGPAKNTDLIDSDPNNPDGPDDSRPSFASISITDTSDTGPPNKAKYVLQYTVDTTGTSFDRVEAEFTNTDEPETDTETLGANENFQFKSGGSRSDDNYDITIRIFDATGEVTSARIDLSDTADGNGIIYEEP